MDEETILKDAYDEVLKKVGRNLLSFQLAEQILKELLRLGGFAIRSGAQEDPFEEIAKRAQKMTLGGLTTLFTENHCTPRDPVFPEMLEDPNEIMIATSFSFNYGMNGLEERQKSLASLVAERNELVHHLLPGFDRDSLESCHAASADLDRQREVVLPEIKRLQEDLRYIRLELSNLIAFIASPEGMKTVNAHHLQQHPLIKEFVDIARNNPTTDEWTSLNAAAARIVGFSRDEISEVCAYFGHKSLTALLIASRLFDIELEPTGTNRHRVLYRLKQDQ